MDGQEARRMVDAALEEERRAIIEYLKSEKLQCTDLRIFAALDQVELFVRKRDE